jgi:hypothetical protein
LTDFTVRPLSSNPDDQTNLRPFGVVAGLGLALVTASQFEWCSDGNSSEVAPVVAKVDPKPTVRPLPTRVQAPAAAPEEIDTGLDDEGAEEETLQEQTQQYGDELMSVLEELQACDLDCNINAHNLPLPGLMSTHLRNLAAAYMYSYELDSNWQIQCQTDYPYEHSLFVAVHGGDYSLDFTDAAWKESFQVPATLSRHYGFAGLDSCSAAESYLEGVAEDLYEAQEDLYDFFQEQAFEFLPYEDADGGCYLAIDAEEGVAMEFCEEEHPLHFSLSLADYDADDEELTWYLEDDPLDAFSPGTLNPYFQNLVYENLGLLEEPIEEDTNDLWLDSGFDGGLD